MPSKKPFTVIAVLLLLVVAVVQLARFVLGWQVMIHGIEIPLWASAIAVIVAGGLAIMVWVEARK